MKIEKDNADFRDYCRLMYSENCTERADHGQNPYPSLEDYVAKNYDFIANKFKDGARLPWIL
tara:strand:+ start:636 stop:821 length:186 start_codon:yes stop_codon:yes gene_type:complete